MSKVHLEHPTQATACGTRATQHGSSFKEFEGVPEGSRCKSCQKVFVAYLAGRSVYRGAVTAIDVSPKAVLTIVLPNDLAESIEKYLATDWNGQTPIEFGALNAVAYIGERLVDLYRGANGR